MPTADEKCEHLLATLDAASDALQIMLFMLIETRALPSDYVRDRLGRLRMKVGETNQSTMARQWIDDLLEGVDVWLDTRDESPTPAPGQGKGWWLPP